MDETVVKYVLNGMGILKMNLRMINGSIHAINGINTAKKGTM
jgi:hypothetical protein